MKSPLCLRSLVLTLIASIAAFAPRAWSSGPGAPPSGEGGAAPSAAVTAVVPGPVRSFLRMAGISQKVTSEEVLPLLARNVFSHGYEGSQTKGRPTEFLILLNRYVQQAREMVPLAGPDGVIRVTNCQDAQPLLQVLGYRIRQDCGHGGTTLETADAQRAFITTDSGFPLPELERTLQGGNAFAYPFPASPVPVLFSESDWVTAENNKNAQNLIDALLRDPSMARLYWAMARIDASTQAALRASPGLKKLAPYAAVLDFYGSHICIRSGRVVVPGGTAAEAAWKELVGESPEVPGEFVLRLVSKDKGWLAAYFDALSRVNPGQQGHLTQAHRLHHFYDALRAPDTSPGAARPVFRPSPGLLLLATRMQWDANGDPHVPGNLDAWKKILRQKSDYKAVGEWGKKAGRWTSSEQLAESMFALSRIDSDAGPLQVYLFLSELDSRRGPDHRLSPETVSLLASRFNQYSNQYLIFSEFPALDDVSISTFQNAAESLTNLSNHTLRGNALGTFQATVGMWQILARQGQIPTASLNQSWQGVVKPFAKLGSAARLVDAGRSSLKELFAAANGKGSVSQDELIDLLAGPRQSGSDNQQIHREVAHRMRSILDAQRLVSLDTILALAEGLHTVDRVKGDSDTLLRLAGELREFEMPRPIFSTSERYEWATGVYNNRHTDLQMRTDLSKVIKSPASAEQVTDARGQLAPFLRDTLVGLNYAYYEPPGAQILHNNPLFVRSHDFSGDTVAGLDRIWQAPQLFGTGFPAGGGAHLVGSLADLPYVLSEAEQNFIAPESVQALIWEQVVPGLLTSAIVPRWWGVTGNELHAVTLYQRAGEELLTAAAQKPELREKVAGILANRMNPQRLERVEQALQAGRAGEILPHLLPADTFYLAAEFRRRFPDQTDSWGPSGSDLEGLIKRFPSEVSWERLSRDFGVPHPVLAQTYTRELLNLEPFPAFMGYSSRLLAESWDSNNLYWARLADEQGYSPVMLNRLVPQLTRRMVEKIFATDFEDWPALLRAARETGDEFRQGKVASLSASGATGAHP